MKNKIKKIIYFISFTILFWTASPVFTGECVLTKSPAKVSVQMSQNYYSTAEIEGIFRQYLSSVQNIKYTKVPRGLIVSIDSKTFFEDGETDILENSKPILDTIADIVVYLDKECVIEGNSNINENSVSLYNWELSAVRVDKIAEYFIKVKKLNARNIQSIGLGDISPVIENMNNRIDFVIINYDKTDIKQ